MRQALLKLIARIATLALLCATTPAIALADTLAEARAAYLASA